MRAAPSVINAVGAEAAARRREWVKGLGGGHNTRNTLCCNPAIHARTTQPAALLLPQHLPQLTGLWVHVHLIHTPPTHHHPQLPTCRGIASVCRPWPHVHLIHTPTHTPTTPRTPPPAAAHLPQHLPQVGPQPAAPRLRHVCQDLEAALLHSCLAVNQCRLDGLCGVVGVCMNGGGMA